MEASAAPASTLLPATIYEAGDPKVFADRAATPAEYTLVVQSTVTVEPDGPVELHDILRTAAEVRDGGNGCWTVQITRDDGTGGTYVLDRRSATDPVRAAALRLLARIDYLTTEEFAHGGEMIERHALKVALGLDEDESLEPLDTPPYGKPKDAGA